MNKLMKQAFLTLTIVSLLGGCTPKTEEESNPVDATQTVSNQENETDVQTVDQDAIRLAFDNVQEQDYGAVRTFVDQHIQQVDPELASDMVLKLIEISKNVVTDANDYIYGENWSEIDQLIYGTYEAHTEQFEWPYAFFGQDKNTLVDLMEEGSYKEELKKYLETGLGLYNAEGSFYFGLDYPDYFEVYGRFVSADINEYLHIMDRESKEHLTVEEYLAVSVEELGRRAVSYEAYLKNAKREETKEDIRILLMVSLWKLVSPSPFDGMADENYVVSKEVMAVYQELVTKDEYPVVQDAVKSILAYIDSREGGVLGSYEDSDEFYRVSGEIHQQSERKIEALYGEQ